MKIKKPSEHGMKDVGYLGHFAQAKYVCEGHNTMSNDMGQKVLNNLINVAKSANKPKAESAQDSDKRCSKLQGSAAQQCYDDARAARSK